MGIGAVVVKVVHRCRDARDSAELDLSFNNMSVLPKEILLCKSLSSVDISTNSFVMFPYLLLEISTISEIKANNNFIAEIDEESFESHESLEEIQLVGNPLNQS